MPKKNILRKTTSIQTPPTWWPLCENQKLTNFSPQNSHSSHSLRSTLGTHSSWCVKYHRISVIIIAFTWSCTLCGGNWLNLLPLFFALLLPFHRYFFGFSVSVALSRFRIHFFAPSLSLPCFFTLVSFALTLSLVGSFCLNRKCYFGNDKKKEEIIKQRIQEAQNVKHWQYYDGV